MTTFHLRIASVLALVLSLSGCAALDGLIQTDDYRASLCADGVVAVPCQDLGAIPVPRGGQSLLSLVVALAGPELAQRADLEDCVFETYPPATDAGKITVIGTALCKFRGTSVTETVTLTLTPVAAAG